MAAVKDPYDWRSCARRRSPIRRGSSRRRRLMLRRYEHVSSVRTLARAAIECFSVRGSRRTAQGPRRGIERQECNFQSPHASKSHPVLTRTVQATLRTRNLCVIFTLGLPVETGSLVRWRRQADEWEMTWRPDCSQRVHLPDGPRGAPDGAGRLSEVRHGARTHRPTPHHRTRTEYTCPMDPQIVQRRSGHCPICGMALEPLVRDRRRAEPRTR